MKILLLFLLSFNLFAQGSDATIEGKISKPKPIFKKKNPYKINLDHYFFDFQGHRAEQNNFYNFEKVTTEIFMATLSYSIDPMTNFSVSVNQRRYFANTVFLGTLFKDETKGLGDTELKLNRAYFRSWGMLVPEVGLSVPTANISRLNPVATQLNGRNINYPYNMQLGTGTFDPFVSLSYIKPIGAHQLGAWGRAKTRLGKNENEYRKGNEFNLKTWYSYMVNPYITPGVWLNAEERKAIVGQDKTFGRNIFTEYYHHDRYFFDATSYVNLQYPLAPKLSVKGMVAVPLWQDQVNYDNLELHTDWFTQVGIEGTF